MIQDDVLAETRDRMAKARDHLQGEFGSIRTGRASPVFVEKLKVDYYGSDVPLQQLAGFSVPEPRLLVISPYDKGAIKAIEKAIQASDLGITPNNDGAVIRLAFPQLTAERRKEMVKIVKHRAEEARVAVRNLRRPVSAASGRPRRSRRQPCRLLRPRATPALCGGASCRSRPRSRA